MENPFEILFKRLDEIEQNAIKRLDEIEQNVIKKFEETSKNLIALKEEEKKDKIYSIKETAQLLGVDIQTIRNYISNGSLRGSKIGKGRRVFIKHSDIFDPFGKPNFQKYNRLGKSSNVPETFIKGRKPIINKVSCIFRLVKSKKNKEGKMPLSMTISYQGKIIRKQFQIRLKENQFKDGVILNADDSITFEKYNNILNRYISFFEGIKSKVLEDKYIITPEYIKEELNKV